MISFDNVTKKYDHVAAVSAFSLEVEKGELCCLIGPSGCGKSTALKMINRMIEPTAGTIRVNGEDVVHADPEQLRRGIGYVIQSIGLFPHMNVVENITVVPKLLGWDQQKARRRARELLELFGLDPDAFSRKAPSELSGGQAQRVGVARALAADPPILLMDEPFGALDPISREHLQNQFLSIQRELRKTIVFVTHDIDEAVRLGAKIALMREGRLVQHAPPEELLSEPKNGFAKQFVGLDRALKRLSRLRAEECLKPCQTITQPVDGHQLARILKRFRQSHRPVCIWVTDDENRLVGRIDGDRPVVDAAAGADLVVKVDPAEVAVQPSVSLKQALSMFVEQKIGCLPVVDEDGRLCGELRLTDIISC